jgi:hypothetical protein
VDNILRETASRAVARETPLSYREMRDRWTDMLDKRNAFQQRMGGKHDNNGRQDGHKPAARGGGSRGRGGETFEPQVLPMIQFQTSAPRTRQLDFKKF